MTIEVLHEIILDLANRNNLMVDCWTGGNNNIDCKTNKNGYIVKFKTFDGKLLEKVEKELIEDLAKYNAYIYDTQFEIENLATIKIFYICEK